ncbi:hypothetical protein LXA43DRAFT_1067473 [Ganoderma leucocontextum]|nr:hypothetical protein LXA43DRAFT_1068399 [Ganoderma leucocontextum]KAI1783620.1 hypothetical protein LXA43DRAFT_1067473 [Ganoderma leucocontextum]
MYPPNQITSLPSPRSSLFLMASRPSKLTEDEETFLKARQGDYHIAKAADKPTWRKALAKHLVEKRGLETSEIMLDFFEQKVYTWLSNHTGKKKKKQTIKLGRIFTGKHCWGNKNYNTIKSAMPEIPPNDPYYCGFTPLIYIRLAWKRAGAWMREVVMLFWIHFRMPLFIYGVFPNENDELKALGYDVSEYFSESGEDTPLFRQMPDWDVNVRQKFYNFFGAVLLPQQATKGTLEAVRATVCQAAKPYEFDNTEDGEDINNVRRQQILRQYMHIHYGFARGRQFAAAPWAALNKHVGEFFDNGMLPAGFIWEDPVKINEVPLLGFFTHVTEMEKPENQDPDGEPRRFRFSHYECVVDGEQRWEPAVYDGAPAERTRRRPKKTVRAPTFVDTPDADHIPNTTSEALPAKPRGGVSGQGPEDDKIRQWNKDWAQYLRARDKASKTKVKATKSKAKAKAKTKPRKSGDFDSDEETTEDEDKEFWNISDMEIELHSPDDDDDGGDDGPEEVEDAEDVSEDEEPHPALGPSHRVKGPQGKGKARAIAVVAPEPDARAPASSILLAPCSVGASGPARFEYLRGLCALAPYQAMVQRLWPKLHELVEIPPLEGFKWANWKHASAHLPGSVHATSDSVGCLVNWLKPGLVSRAPTADAQRFCLIIGLTLRDIHVAQFLEPDADLPEDIPPYLANTSLSFAFVETLSEACRLSALVRPRLSAKSNGSAGHASQAQPPSYTSTPRPQPATLSSPPGEEEPTSQHVREAEASAEKPEEDHACPPPNHPQGGSEAEVAAPPPPTRPRCSERGEKPSDVAEAAPDPVASEEPDGPSSAPPVNEGRARKCPQNDDTMRPAPELVIRTRTQRAKEQAAPVPTTRSISARG